MEARLGPPDLLLNQATRIQLAAKENVACREDTLLLTTKTNVDIPCGVHMIKHSELRIGLTEQITKRSPIVEKNFGPGAQLARQVFASQKKDNVTTFQLPGCSPSSELLPGGLPIIDHYAAFITNNSGFEALIEPVNRLRQMRVPSEQQLSNTEVCQITLGLSSAKDMEEAAAWIRKKKQDTALKFAGLAVCAADTENITLLAEDNISTDTKLFDALGQDVASVRLKMPIAMIDGATKEKTIQCPVLYMYGSIGWQLHIRFNIQYRYKTDNDGVTRTEVIFHRGLLPDDAYRSLLFEINEAFGIEISKDYIDFFNMAGQLYGNNLLPRGDAIDLARLAMLAGSDHPQTGLVSLVWLWLGGVLAKHYLCSMGDNKWGKPFEDLPIGLKLYLLGDIQPIAGVAMLMLWTLATHLFPDPLPVLKVTNMHAPQLITHWAEMVIKLMGKEPERWNNKPAHQQRHGSRSALLSQAGIPDDQEYDVLKLCLSWPAITNGGPRYSLPVACFILENYSVLRKHDPKTWAAYSSEELNSLLTSSVVVKGTRSEETAPSNTTVLAVLPSQNSDWLNLPVDELTRQNLRQEMNRENQVLRNVLAKYLRHDKYRALQLMLYWEGDRKRVENLIGKDRYLPSVRDVRKFLEANGMTPVRPEGWVDPLGEAQYDALVTANLIKHNELADQVAKAVARRKIIRAREHREAAQTAKDDNVSSVHATDPLARVAGPRDSNIIPGQTAHKKHHRNKKCRMKDRLRKLRDLGMLEANPAEVESRFSQYRNAPNPTPFSNPQETLFDKEEEILHQQNAVHAMEVDEPVTRRVVEVDTEPATVPVFDPVSVSEKMRKPSSTTTGRQLESMEDPDEVMFLGTVAGQKKSNEPVLKRTVVFDRQPAMASVIKKSFVPMSRRGIPATTTSGDLEELQRQNRETSPTRYMQVDSEGVGLIFQADQLGSHSLLFRTPTPPKLRNPQAPQPTRLPMPMPSWIEKRPMRDYGDALPAKKRVSTKMSLPKKMTVNKKTGSIPELVAAPESTSGSVLNAIPLPVAHLNSPEDSVTSSDPPKPARRPFIPLPLETSVDDLLLDSDEENKDSSNSEPTKKMSEAEIELLLNSDEENLLGESPEKAKPETPSTNSILKKPEDTVKICPPFKPAAKISFGPRVEHSDGIHAQLKTSVTAPAKLIPGKRKRAASAKKQPKKMSK